MVCQPDTQAVVYMCMQNIKIILKCNENNIKIKSNLIWWLKRSNIFCLISLTGPAGAECQCPQGNWYLANNGRDCIKDVGHRCQPEQFTCLNGGCISQRWKCDGYRDCFDGSDELERVCGEDLSGKIRDSQTHWALISWTGSEHSNGHQAKSAAHELKLV